MSECTVVCNAICRFSSVSRRVLWEQDSHASRIPVPSQSVISSTRPATDVKTVLYRGPSRRKRMKFVRKVDTWLLAVLFLSGCTGYRILGVFPFWGKSHFMMFGELTKILASKGHQVDVISPYPLKKPVPNYTDLIELPTPRVFVNNFTYSEMKRLFLFSTVKVVTEEAGNAVCSLLSHPEIRQLIAHPPRDPPYDAVVIEIFGANCFAILGHLLNVPIIGASSSALYPWMNSIIANPENLAFMPNNLIAYPNEMSFWQRVYNVGHTIFNKVYFNYATSVQDDVIREVFGEGLPSVRELERKVSLILVNSHISITGVRPMTPALVEVGGLHVQENTFELSPALEKWMNESTAGFVYFTFGSMIMIESFPTDMVNIFYKSLGKLAPIRVLMKVADQTLLPPGLPENIHVQSWMPQVNILKHPNIKAFITHGGLMGTQEAIYCGVPLIGVPLFADQFINIDTYVAKRIAVKLDIDSLTEQTMDRALNAVLKDPVYREAMKNVSAKFVDRPMTPADTAVYWVEYVIRNGPDALRSPAMKLSWWQLELLDVYAFLLLLALATVLAIVTAVSSVARLIAPSASGAVTRAKKVS